MLFAINVGLYMIRARRLSNALIFSTLSQVGVSLKTTAAGRASLEVPAPPLSLPLSPKEPSPNKYSPAEIEGTTWGLSVARFRPARPFNILVFHGAVDSWKLTEQVAV